MHNVNYLELFKCIDMQTIVITANTHLKTHFTELYLAYLHDQGEFVIFRENCLNSRILFFTLFFRQLFKRSRMLNPSYTCDFLNEGTIENTYGNLIELNVIYYNFFTFN